MPARVRPFAAAFAAACALLALAPALPAQAPPHPASAQAPHPLSAAERQRVEDLIRQMTLEEKLDYIGGTGFASREVPRLHIPAFQMSDGPVGVRSNSGFPSTTYAGGIGLAASWDRSLAEQVGAGIGRDARARGVHYMLGPGVCIYRSPRNGRNFEYFGEDPYLAASMALGYIAGMQAQGVSATIKHYAGNNSEYLRHDEDSIIDARTLHEIYLVSFEAAVKQGHVGAVMDSYNLLNGEHATQNPTLNIDYLRRDFGFEGTLMSDWMATYDGVAAANGGLDIEMPFGSFMNAKTLEPAIRAGKVQQATIDAKIRHLLTTAMEFGWLDRPQADPGISYLDRRNAQAALRSAEESPVLLKNDGHLLPLERSALHTVLVVGPDAYPGAPVGGGSAAVTPFHRVTALDGLTDALGGSATVYYERGLPTLSDLALATSFTTAAEGGRPGLTLEAFTNPSLEGAPAATTTEPYVNYPGISFDTLIEDPAQLMAVFSAPPKQMSRRFTGYYTAPAAGRYILALAGSGEGSGNRVYVDGRLIFDDWELMRALQPTATIELTQGPHKVVIEDRQTGPLGGRLRFGIAAESSIVSERAKQLAARADVVVVSAGFAPDSESEGADRTFTLPFGQDELIRAMAQANKKVIVTVTSGGNVDSTGWLDRVPVLLETWYGGQEAGRALAEILLGEVNPSGHLPATFEREARDNPAYDNYYPAEGTRRVEYREGIFVGYRGYQKNHVRPLFPFGYGLSYTTFRFGGLSVSPESAGANPRVTVAFDVTNTGRRRGAEVAQVYVSEDHARVPRPERELKGFERVDLAPGETRHVSVALDARSFAYWSPTAKQWTIDPGRFTIRVGDAVDATPLEGRVTLSEAAAHSSF